jgi:hypothetical protein
MASILSQEAHHALISHLLVGNHHSFLRAARHTPYNASHILHLVALEAVFLAGRTRLSTTAREDLTVHMAPFGLADFRPGQRASLAG